MGTPVDYALADLVAHSDPMRLIDRALEAHASGMVAEVTIREDCLFFRDGGVGGWVGIEFMAQTVGAWAGWNARLRGETPKVGFLLGTRRYSCSRPVFKVGERLRIQVRQELWAESGLGQFACTIDIQGETVASAALTVFEAPEEAGE